MFYPKKPIFVLATVVSVSMLAVGSVVADENDEIPFAEAQLFFELNDTDGDLGIHGKVDGEEWKYLEIEDPRDRKMMNVWVRGRLRRQGLTELFFESAEPTFDELDPERFFKRFHEGEYDIEGYTLDGEERESEVYLSHVIPAAPDGVGVNGEPSADLETCEEGTPPIIWDATEGVVINWEPVEESHAAKHADDPDKIALGENGVVDVRYYEVVVEIDESDFKMTSIIPGDETEWEIPGDFFEMAEGENADGEECEGGSGCYAKYKYEILVRTNVYDADGNPVMVGMGDEEGNLPGNKSAMESCFLVPVEYDDD
jgi:hypothetical protein